MVYLSPFEKSDPTPYRPHLVPTRIDQEETQVSEPQLAFQDLSTGLELSLSLDPIQLQTLSHPDTVEGEKKEPIDELLDDYKILLAGPFFERSLVPAEHLTQSNTETHPSSLGRVAEGNSSVHPIGKGAPLVPRTALATPARFSSSLGRSPYLDSAVFLLNPISAGRDGQIGAKVLLSSVNPFGLGKFDIRDFMVPFRETKHQQEAPWENLSLLGPRESLNDPFEVVLSGSGLGASLLDARLANWSDHRRAHEASYLTSWWESLWGELLLGSLPARILEKGL
jgi:hypothetical protein